MSFVASNPLETAPFLRVREYLTGGTQIEDARLPGIIVMSPEFERIALSPGWRATERLTAIAEVAKLVPVANLPQRERNLLVAELSRLSLRILWWQGLLGPGMAPEAKPDVAAAVLVEVTAAGLLPEGPAGWMVLERAKFLLTRSDVIKAFQANESRRVRLVQQLAAAEERVLALQL